MSEARLEDLPARERQWLRTHRRILAASLAEFERVGVDAARVEHICRAAGVTRPTFYAHFPTKDDVLFEMQREGGGARRRADDGASSTRPPRCDEVVDLLADGLFYTTSLVSPRLRREIQSLFVRKQGVADWEGTTLLRRAGALLPRRARLGRDRRRRTMPEALTRWVFVTLVRLPRRGPDRPRADSRSEARRFLHVLMAGLREQGRRSSAAISAARGRRSSAPRSDSTSRR